MDSIDDVGALVTAGMAARTVEHAGQTPGHADAHHLQGHDCANCGARLTGDYCQACGQAAHLHRDMVGFAHDVLHGVFHFDGKFWSTLPLLAFQPGRLTRRYIDGERAKFVTPMAMFLFSVFLMFLVVGNVPGWFSPDEVEAKGPSVEVARQDIAQSIGRGQARLDRLVAQRTTVARAGGDTAPIDRKLAETRNALRGLRVAERFIPGQAADAAKLRVTSPLLGAAAQDRTGTWLQQKFDHARENPKLLFYKMKSSGYKYSWALIPMSLPFLWAMFAWRRRFGLYDHAVFATYSIAFMSLLVVVLTLVGWTFGSFGRTIAWGALFLVPPVHMYKQLRHGYELRRFSAFWRTVALLHVVSFTSLAFFLLLLSLGLAD
ncbi:MULTISPECIES: DUF3667 domain-containing protein [unclassified Sphingomonas]|uniref:DUF3667 domain-containing protein n=1 Tax=unclassified Sphingomonas TaxID=196159 RepID=UPI0009EBB035|nr:MULTISPECIES: DUF3667 domain-containing protein [unclassified Sphingomonas]